MLYLLLLFLWVAASPVHLGAVQTRLQARKLSILDGVYQSLPQNDTDFIAEHLAKLRLYNGLQCSQCHNKIVYAKQLIEEYPAKDYLVLLLMYEYCLTQNKGKDSKCEFVDFFVTTTSHVSQKQTAALGPVAGVEGATLINFFYNDFVQMVRFFNTSSLLSLDYYCHYKGGYCKAPKTPSVADVIDLDAMWPQKTPERFAEPQYKQENRSVFNVLHLLDFHNELRYTLGAEANCSQGLCCLPELYNDEIPGAKYNFTSVYQTLGAVNLSFYNARYVNDSVEGSYVDLPGSRGWNWVTEPATTWGNYECDPPEIMLNNSLKSVASTMSDKRYEFALFTGDIVDHDELHCDANVTRYAEERSYGIMKHYLQGLPVYPTLGNHDTFPYGQLAPQRVGNHTFNESLYHWNDHLVSRLWINNGWLNALFEAELKKHYLGFSVETLRGLKVISLNSNCYYQKNLYAYIDVEKADLFGQWEFLVGELVESEQKNQRVWILAHIPAGDTDALPIQSAIFARIVERFSPNTIANIFYGHTHRDQFKVLYGSNGSAVNMAWISQAITPLGPANPSWRYYAVEDESFNIVDAYNYFTPLNATWVHGLDEPQWLFEYSPRAVYDPHGTWPKSAPLNATFWDTYVMKRLRNDVEFNQKYTDLMFRMAPNSPSCQNATAVAAQCYTDNYCYNAGFTVDEYNKCVADMSK